MFSNAKPQNSPKLQKPQVDPELKQLTDERSAILKKLDAANNKVATKIRARQPAHYYEENTQAGFAVLDNPLEDYQRNRDAIEIEQMEIERKIRAKMLELYQKNEPTNAPPSPGKR